MELDHAAVVWPGADAAERKAAAGYRERQEDALMDFSWYGYWARRYEESPEEMWDYGEEDDEDDGQFAE